MDWWSYLETIPAPRFVVLKDADHVPGVGALVGEIHANIFRALGCTAVVTNGAVRDVEGVETSGLQVFASNVAVSHAYAHVTDFGEAVEVAGLLVKPGDLLHGDRHGVHCIPKSIASQIAATAAAIRDAERQFISRCKSEGMSVNELYGRIEQLSRKLKQPACAPHENS
jgi:regulator of RNase E activity RraA